MMYVDPTDIPLNKDVILSKGDIIVVRSGAYTGDSAIIPNEYDGAIAGYDIIVTLLKDFSPFVAWQLLSPHVREFQFELNSLRAAQPHLNAEQLGETLIFVPTIPEQHAIAAFLDRETAKIDALIEKKRRLIGLLEEKRAAIISHSVTKGLDPDAPMKDSGVEWLREIPAGWEVKRLKFISDVLSGVAKGKNLRGKDVVELPYLRVANVQEGYVDLTDVDTIEIALGELERYSLMTGDVLMNEGGDYDKLGRGAVWNGSIDPCVHQNHVFAVRPHSSVNPNWISMITQTSYAKHYFILKSKQSTNLASISSTNIKELPLILPPENEMAQILTFIKINTSRINALIDKIHQAINKLQEYRTALISAAVTGKIDVREASL
jgi:type I restriction enzyme S subunit